ncbi:MAG TPA: hypothetical protein VKG25_23990 [Bryobacteraceae bacterium]|nr:hypothetical protein [Bryobacteraceae bacterium]
MKYTSLLLFCGLAASAQEPAPAVIQEQPVVFSAGGAVSGGIAVASMQDMKYLAEGFALEHKVVTGAPYSASAVTETVQTLADGNHIRHSTTSSVARDSQGRTRREQSLSGPAALAGNVQLPTLVFIQDPVAQTSYVLEPDTKIARSAPAGAALNRMPPPLPNQMTFISKATAKAPDAKADVKKESLGSQTISGVRADGNRVTRTIAAGEMGNEKPIEVVTETWYSTDLQAVVRSKTSDPRIGETTFELQNIDRTEPSASLFTVPADYTVQEGAGPVTIMRHTESHE